MKKIAAIWEYITDAIGQFVALLGLVGLVLFFLLAIKAHLFGEIEHKPSAGERCGPGAHWKWVGPPDPYGDLSCEDD